MNIKVMPKKQINISKTNKTFLKIFGVVAIIGVIGGVAATTAACSLHDAINDVDPYFDWDNKYYKDYNALLTKDLATIKTAAPDRNQINAKITKVANDDLQKVFTTDKVSKKIKDDLVVGKVSSSILNYVAGVANQFEIKITTRKSELTPITEDTFCGEKSAAGLNGLAFKWAPTDPATFNPLYEWNHGMYKTYTEQVDNILSTLAGTLGTGRQAQNAQISDALSTSSLANFSNFVGANATVVETKDYFNKNMNLPSHEITKVSTSDVPGAVKFTFSIKDGKKAPVAIDQDKTSYSGTLPTAV